MARTTINIQNKIWQKLRVIAQRENRSAPNLIETILIAYMNEGVFVDDFEMKDIKNDKTLKQNIQKALADYKKGRGQFV